MSSGEVLADVPAPVVDLLAEFLSSIYGAEPDPLVHLASYAPGALILVGDRVARRQDVDVLDYVEATESAVAARAAAERRGERVAPAFELGRALDCRAAEDVAAVRAVVREARTRREFEAVFVVEDAGVLGGCLLEPRPWKQSSTAAGNASDWLDPYLAQAMVAAEFAQPPSASGTDSCLTGLELSYDRLVGGTLSAAAQFGVDRELAPVVSFVPPGAMDIPLRSLPEARFSCSMCGESCRAGKWRNTVSDAARLALEAMPWERTHPGRLPADLVRVPDGAEPGGWHGGVELGVREDGWCVFFDGAAGCLVHRLLGRQPIPSCHQFPFAFTRTPDGIDVWTTFHCHAALEGHGSPLADREADVRSRLWAARTPQRWVGREVLLSGDATTPWPVYRAVEAALLDFLDLADDDPLASRLHAAEGFMRDVIGAGGGLSEAAVAALHRRWKDASRLTRPLAGAPDPLVAGLVAGLYKRYPPPAGTLDFPEDDLGTRLSAVPPATGCAVDLPDSLLARYLRHTLFHKHFLQTEGALFTWRLALLCYAVVRLYARSLAAFAREGLIAPLAMHPLQKAIHDNDRVVIHSGTYFARFLKGYPAEYDRLMGPDIAPALIWA